MGLQFPVLETLEDQVVCLPGEKKKVKHYLPFI